MNEGNPADLPAVSVITPAHNAAGVIERCIRAVSRQTLPVLEHVVIDDGSTDATATIAADLALRMKHLRIVSRQRSGAAQARNHGIRLARGRYIAFLDSDDEWLPGKLAAQLAFMQQHQVAFSYGDYQRLDSATGKPLGTVQCPASLLYRDFLHGCPIGCLTVAYDRETLGRVLMPEVGRGHDWGLWLRLTRDGTRACKYPGTHAVYHVRRGSLSGRKLRKTIDIYRIYRRQEKIGVVRSAYLLIRHIVNSFR
ncbi:MAG: glycosyltransferase family 2 protein [Pseudomonadota bacterium]|nr:MAG: glycosyltransferase family 2 protein [Pseudomonadota bacterium]